MSSAPSSAANPEWSEEWVPLPAIIKHAPWQVRVKLDDRAVRRYAEMTRAGNEPPPIKVGRVKGRRYLVDGWHRMEAGALQISSSIDDDETVKALVADLTQAQAIWEAARANLGHGVQYKSKDLHGVFKAFIKSKQHVKPGGGIMSYREIAPIIGKPHTTIRT